MFSGFALEGVLCVVFAGLWSMNNLWVCFRKIAYDFRGGRMLNFFSFWGLNFAIISRGFFLVFYHDNRPLQRTMLLNFSHSILGFMWWKTTFATLLVLHCNQHLRHRRLRSPVGVPDPAVRAVRADTGSSVGLYRFKCCFGLHSKYFCRAVLCSWMCPSRG